MDKVAKLLLQIHRGQDRVSLEDLYKLSNRDLLITNFALNISIYSILKKISMNIDEVLKNEQDENLVITQLAGAVKSLAEGYQTLQQKLDALIKQGTSIEPVTAQQLQQLSDEIASGKQAAADALAQAQSVLNPTPAPKLDSPVGVANPEPIQG